MFKSGDEVLKFITDNKVQFVDVRFCDLPGTVQHFTIPTESFDDKVSPKAACLTAPRFAGSSRSTSRTCS